MEEVVTSDVTDEQAQEFFDSKGEKAPEAKQEPKQEEQKQEPKRESVVPLAALHEERARRKELAEKVSKMETRWTELVTKLSPRQEVQIPDVAQDPVGHFQAKTAHLEQTVQKQSETLEQFQQRQAQEQQIQQFDNQYRMAAQQFASQNPEFGPAYSHFVTSRQQAMLAQGIEPQEMALRLAHEERQIAQTAFMLGLNPGQLLYQTAMSLGYAPKAQKQQAEEKMDRLEKGTQAKTLSNVAGKAKQNLTLEALADMDDEEFNKHFDTLIRQT